MKKNDEMIAVLEKGAAMGLDRAKSLLGLAYAKDSGSEKNRENGFAILHAQATGGDADACYYLGLLSEDDDRKTALSWYEKGAAKGSSASMLMLGHRYEQENNRKQAAYWYEKAAKAGNENALMSLLELAESARDVAALTKWLGIIILRSSDPMIVYRTRSLMGQMGYGQPWDSYQKILMEAEKWHKANPLPRKKTPVAYRNG